MRHARGSRFGWLPALLVSFLTAPMAFLTASAARAQESEARRIHIMPYAGVFVFDDDELQEANGVEVDIGPVLGARLGYALSRSWQVEGAYGLAPLSTEPSEFDESESPDEDLGDLTAHLVYGAVDYFIAYEGNPTELLLTAGAGVIVLDPEGGDADGDFLLELGAGFTHPVRDWITIRGDARDHIAFCSASEEPGDSSACPLDDDILHHIEVSAGLEFWLF